MQELDQNRFTTVKEIALYLRLETATVTAWLVKGEMPGYQVGRSWRIDREEFKQWLEERKNSDTKNIKL